MIIEQSADNDLTINFSTIQDEDNKNDQIKDCVAFTHTEKDRETNTERETDKERERQIQRERQIKRERER